MDTVLSYKMSGNKQRNGCAFSSFGPVRLCSIAISSCLFEDHRENTSNSVISEAWGEGDANAKPPKPASETKAHWKASLQLSVKNEMNDQLGMLLLAIFHNGY
jgi:hypothetical protein